MILHEPKVFIVDDDPAICDSLTLMLEQAVIKAQTFKTAEMFLNSLSADSSGCVIIDVRMPGMDGLQLQEEIARRNIRPPLIFLTGHGDIPMSVRAIKNGAMDFLTKPVTRKKLLNSVQSAFVEGEKKIKEAAATQDAVLRIATLTQREREVMLLAAQGCCNKVIANRLNISHRTVEIHKSKIMHKTGALTLLDLARIVHEIRLTG